MTTDTRINFSFLKLMNHVKGIGRAHKPEEVDEYWLEKRANPQQKTEWKNYLKFCD